eukprot:750985-Hanusia_phi.AAC.3
MSEMKVNEITLSRLPRRSEALRRSAARNSRRTSELKRWIAMEKFALSTMRVRDSSDAACRERGRGLTGELARS